MGAGKVEVSRSCGKALCRLEGPGDFFCSFFFVFRRRVESEGFWKLEKSGAEVLGAKAGKVS